MRGVTAETSVKSIDARAEFQPTSTSRATPNGMPTSYPADDDSPLLLPPPSDWLSDSGM